jgi:hypothetical protein
LNAPDARQSRALSRICRRLDGLPLSAQPGSILIGQTITSTNGTGLAQGIFELSPDSLGEMQALARTASMPF